MRQRVKPWTRWHGGILVPSMSGVGTVTLPVPDAPVISADALSSSSIEITLVSGDGDVFEIERSLNGTSGWTQISADANFPYAATGLSASTLYYFRCRAQFTGGSWSAWSEVVSDTTEAAAEPGDLVHGEEFDFSVSGAGTRTGLLRDIFDNCDNTANIGSRWNDVVSMSYQTPAAAGIGIGLPHGNITRYAIGQITSGSFYTYNAWLSTLVSGYSRPMRIFCTAYRRMNPNWVFGAQCGTGTDNDNNHKFFAVSVGSVFSTPYWYHDMTGQKCSYNGSWGDSFYSSGGLGNMNFPSGQRPQSGGSGAASEDPWHNWVKYEYRLIQDSSAGRIRYLLNNVHKTNNSNYNNLNNDNSSSSSRSFAIGGYGRSGPANRHIMLADIAMVIGDNAFKRLMLANNATYANATIVEYQPIVTWANGNIRARINMGALSAGTVHAFWFDADDNPIYIGPYTISAS